MTDEELHGHLVGQQGSRRDLNTPVLVVDLDALTRNVAAMAAFARGRDVALRPHAKTHKSPEIARRQIAAGAVGICCAKIGEAEVLADAGVAVGLHITSPIVSAPAIARLIALNARTERLMCVVDSAQNVRDLGRAARDKPLDIIIDIDPGLHRTGVVSPHAAVGVLEAIRSEPGLRYRGVQFYCGSQQHIPDFNERRDAMRGRAERARSVIHALTAAGGHPEIVTGGGTGTHRIDVELGLFTELQVGSYVFMDGQYQACDLTGEASGSPFETALMVDARVVSANTLACAPSTRGSRPFAPTPRLRSCCRERWTALATSSWATSTAR
jgi:3-hydroxy-D-aspartate aldolase